MEEAISILSVLIIIWVPIAVLYIKYLKCISPKILHKSFKFSITKDLDGSFSSFDSSFLCDLLLFPDLLFVFNNTISSSLSFSVFLLFNNSLYFK